MLTATMQPITGAGLLARIRSFFTSTSYGVVRQRVGPARELIHIETELTFQQLAGEDEEAFTVRVYAEVQPGDQVEWRVKGNKVWAAEITRRADLLPIAQGDVRNWDEFMLHYREFCNRPRA